MSWVSDNGPCYRGEQFGEFLKRKGIKHTTSSPYYPQSNGLAEAYVKGGKKHDEESSEMQSQIQ